MASFGAFATQNLTAVLAEILIFSSVFGLMPIRAFLFCFASFPNLAARIRLLCESLYKQDLRAYPERARRFFCSFESLRREQFEVLTKATSSRLQLLL
jgi:hypothetical protein